MLGGISPACGGDVTTLTSASTLSTTHAAQMAYWMIRCTPGGTVICQTLTPSSSTHEIGSRYFRQVIITWSMRSRGSVQRTHIITNTSSQPLAMNTVTLMRLPKIGP